MSPEAQRAQTRRVAKSAYRLMWGVAISAIAIGSAIGVLLLSGARTGDLARGQAQQAAERFRNTVLSCEEQNGRNVKGKAALSAFLSGLTSRPGTEAQREIVDRFAGALMDATVPARVDKQGRSTCEAYARQRVKTA